MKINLLKPEHSHFYGMSLTDGHLREGTRNRGSLCIEINQKDSDLIKKYNLLFPDSKIHKRTRYVKNFDITSNYIDIIFCNKLFRDELKSYGFPVGKKSEIVSLPTCEFSEPDFWRGVIDGDGSLGVVKQGFPFISLVTKSELLANSYKDLIFKICEFKPTTKRNSRDGVYNIMLIKEKAVKIVNYLYYDGCFGMDRKIELSKQIKSWTRPLNMKMVPNVKRWTVDEIEFIKFNSIQKSQKKLNRSFESIIQKLRKLNIKK